MTFWQRLSDFFALFLPGPDLPTPFRPDPPAPAPIVPLPVPPPTPNDWQVGIVAAINAERIRAGVAPLSADPRLAASAGRIAADNAVRRTLDHVGGDGSTFGVRIEAAGYRWRSAGECLDFAAATPAAVVRAWIDSPPHRSIILSKYFSNVGVGVAGAFIAADFASPA
jgi:uncharacterized protein YkwD